MGKNQPKKLVLNRETVRDLTSRDMERVEGGGNKPLTAGKDCPDLSKTGDPCAFC